jgi:cytochrome c oxidase assembly protein subunit 15
MRNTRPQPATHQADLSMHTDTPGARSNPHDRLIAVWLFVCCGMVFAMVILGGVTRLTGSGLSMVEWDPIFGIIPPLDQQTWNETFELYKQSPEYLKINAGMDLAGFKQIYWFEFSHRLLGRLIGVVFLLPLLFFLLRGWVSRPLVPRLLGMFVIGGLQGLLGWYMVKSGLVDNPHVSQYRLTAHLGLAVVIYGYMLYVALGLWFGTQHSPATPAGLRRAAAALWSLVFVTLLSGGFVAGLKAGFAYNTFPLMNGRLIPESLLVQEPLWRNFFENAATVQFDHRVLAITTVLGIVALWLSGRRLTLPGQVRIGMHLLLAAGLLQASLGISTLLLHVPTALASLHQAGALLVFSAALFLYHRMLHSKSPATS